MFCTTCENLCLEYCYSYAECMVKKPLKKAAVIIIEKKNLSFSDKWELKKEVIPLMLEFHMDQTINNERAREKRA